MPSIQRLYDSMKTERAAFLMVSDEEPERVRKFVVKKGYTFPVYIAGGQAPAAFESRGIPATFIVDRTGAIVFRQVGGAKWDDDSCRRFLHKLMP
jgi:peroxiredoxin